ncbi:aldolase [Aureococcus anophagefferens]|nr:aldolase [Aureococcus anophagefferens]
MAFVHGSKVARAASRVASRSIYTKTVDNYESVLDRFARDRLTAVLRTPTAEAAPKAMAAAIDGGFKIAEFTLTTPGCLDAVADFRGKYDGDVMVGCGTIMCTEDAEAACDAGAEFIITPVLLPEVVTWCAQRNIVCVPGCQTPTELYTRPTRSARPLQKVFPGVAGAVTWVKAVSAALPMLRLNPTSGVDLDNAGEYLSNGAASVGLVAPLFPPDAIANEDWDAIHANATKVVGNAAKAGPFVRKPTGFQLAKL